MWVECESGELLNLDRADKIVIARDLLIAMVNEPEQWADLGVICSVKDLNDGERRGVMSQLLHMLSEPGLCSFRYLLMKYPG